MLASLKARVREHPTYTAAIVAVAGWLTWEPLRAALPWGIATRVLLMTIVVVSVLALLRLGHDVLGWLLEAGLALGEKRERERNPALAIEKDIAKLREKIVQDAWDVPMSEIISRYPAAVDYMANRRDLDAPTEDITATILHGSKMIALEDAKRAASPLKSG